MAKKTFENGKPINITLGPDVRFLFPYVFEKRQNDEGEDKYEVLIQIPYKNKKAIELFEDAIDAAIERGHSGELSDKSTFKKGTKDSTLKIPLKDGTDKEHEEYGDLFAGYFYATAKTSRRPTILDENGQQILDPEDFRMGATGAVNITVFPYNNRAQGVGVMLNHIMKLGEDESIGGNWVSPDDAFADYLGGRSTGERTPTRSRSRDDEAEERRPSRGGGRRDNDERDERDDRGSRGGRSRRGSDDPMFD